MGSNHKFDFQLIEEPLEFYVSMMHDIEKANNYIYLETYRFRNDSIGIRFRDLLTKKAKEGVEIKLIIDAWGATVNETFFKEFIEAGGKLRFFKKLRLTINLFSANHERDHRKILIIDDSISYLGSANITNYNLNWRELILRIKGDITLQFKTIFLEQYKLKVRKKYNKKRNTRTLYHESFEIIRDVPSLIIQRIKNKYLHLIKNAKKEILIESPYFLPSRLLRENLAKAISRGVKVIVIMPERSDVNLINLLREYYLGKLYQSGIQLYFYSQSNLHAKLMIVDDHFVIGSANFDYRSFLYQFEIALYGCDNNISKELSQHFNKTLSDSNPFDYERWQKRTRLQKLIERILLPFRHFL